MPTEPLLLPTRLFDHQFDRCVDHSKAFNKNVKIHSRIQILIRLTSNKRISSRVRGRQ
jgi:hypothetical protein